MPYHCAKLLNLAMRRGMQNDFSFKGVEQAMLEQFGPMMNSDISDEQLAKARELQDHYETIRLDNIAAYDREGLMPFERQAKAAGLGES